MIELGGNINLVGFSDFDSATMIILKKIIGNYVRRYSEINPGLDGVTISVKKIHGREISEKYDIHAKVMIGAKPYNSEMTDRNLFVATDSVLKKIEKLIV